VALLPPPPPLAQRLPRVHSTHCGDRNCKQPEHMVQSTAPYALGASFAVKRHDLLPIAICLGRLEEGFVGRGCFRPALTAATPLIQ
jgi:hypothetical protein